MPVPHVAIHAAQNHERQIQMEEEEKMTRYTSEDLENNWEFKIVRSTFGAFRNPRVLRGLIQEEAQAGWEMVEKFDDYRVRFKRSVQARRNDSMLPENFDPYRTQYGAFGNRNIIITISLLVAIMLAAGVALFVFRVL